MPRSLQFSVRSRPQDVRALAISCRQSSQVAIPMQFSIRRLMAVVLIVALLCVCGVFLRGLVSAPDDAYAMWGAGDLLIEFMIANDGRWPDDWDELDTYLESTSDKSTMGGSVAELEKRILINFDFDPAQARKSIRRGESEAILRPVRTLSGFNTHFDTVEPNQRIHDYLKQQKFGSPTQTDAMRSGGD